jgi:hypothetical protein
MSLLSGAQTSGSVETQHSIKAVSPGSGAADHAGGRPARSPGCLFPAMARPAVVALMIPLETSCFLAFGAAHSGNAYFPEK